MKTKHLLALLLFASLCATAKADTIENENQVKLPTVVVTASRSETELKNIGRSIDTRDAEEIDAQKVTTLSEALQTVAGVSMPAIGGPGTPGLTPLEIRGFRSGGTKLLYDGMVLDDPTSVSGTYESFYSYQSTFDISTIEVLKGSAGVLYGSDAQAGAVNLIPFAPHDGAKGTFLLEGGAYESLSEGVMLNYGQCGSGAVGSFFHDATNGLDANGDYQNSVVALKGMVSIIEDKLAVSPVLRAINASTDLDTSPALSTEGNLITNQDTEKNNVDADAYLLGLSGEYSYDQRASSKIAVYYNNTERHYLFDFSGFESRSRHEGQSLHVENQNTIEVPELQSKLTAGVEFVHQKIDSYSEPVRDIAQRDQYGAYIYDQSALIKDRWDLALGFRLTHVTDISKAFPTLESSMVLQLPETSGRIHGSIAQGFCAPTLFESKGQMQDFNTGEIITVGNSNLEEEKSRSWDVGYEQKLGSDKLLADLTFFQIKSDQTILFDYANNTHVNGGGGNTQGLEFSTLAIPTDWLSSRLALTYLDQADGLDNTRRQREPWQWWTWSNYAHYNDLGFTTILRYRGSQLLDFYGTSERYKENAVTTLDAVLSYKLTKEAEVFLKANNIFNVEYTEAGYSMPDASYYLGVKVIL